MKNVLITIKNVKFFLKHGSGCFLYLANTEYGEEVYGFASVDMNNVERARDAMKEDAVSLSIPVEGIYLFQERIDSDFLEEQRIAEVAPVSDEWPNGWCIASEAIVKVEMNWMKIIITLSNQSLIESPSIYTFNGPAIEKVASDLSIDLKDMSQADIEKMKVTMAFRRMITNNIAIGQSSTTKKGATGISPADNPNLPF